MQYTVKDNITPTTQECGASLQTFCKINGQQVNNNITITYENTIIEKETINLKDIWNEIQETIKMIHDFGNYGTRNPDKSNLTDKVLGELTTLNYYNDLLSRIDKNTLTGIQYITASDFISNLQDGLKTYTLNSNRCNVCNSSCQYCDTCQSCDANCQNQGYPCCWSQFCMDCQSSECNFCNDIWSVCGGAL